ncbi:MAG: hypothetical protein KAI33_02085 [Elusimicrobiales bacterium]|nr:hypothetical protein [Elusimicrobiales bacterium]
MISKTTGSKVNFSRLSFKSFFSFGIKFITLIKSAVISPAQTESSKTAAHGEAKVNNIKETPTLTKERISAEKSMFLAITAAKAKMIMRINRAK